MQTDLSTRGGRIVADSNPLPANSGTDVVTALAAVAVTGTSAAIDLGTARSNHTMQTVVTGGPTVSAILQGSLDGANWATLATSTSATGDMQHAVDKPVRYLRVAVTLTGGTAPTFTARVCSQ